MTGMGKIASSIILVIHSSESGDVQNPVPKVMMTASVVFSILYLNTISMKNHINVVNYCLTLGTTNFRLTSNHVKSNM